MALTFVLEPFAWLGFDSLTHTGWSGPAQGIFAGEVLVGAIALVLVRRARRLSVSA